MDLTPLARVLASTERRGPARTSRVLYLADQGEGLAPAGYADAVGDVATVLDRLDAEGADGLAVQLQVPDGEQGTMAAVVVSRAGGYALAITDGDDEVVRDAPPRRDDSAAVATCWRLVVHGLAAVDRSDAVPEPPDDPHPAAYLAGAWMRNALETQAADGHPLDGARLPSEEGLVGALDLPTDLRGWDAVYAAVRVSRPVEADRLGRNGVAWEAHELLGDPGSALAAVAEAVGVATADAFFDALVDRGWARPVGTA